MCKELNDELKRGSEAMLALVTHLHNMGAAELSDVITVEGNKYAVIVKYTSCCGHDSDCAIHNEPAEPAGKCDCSASDDFGKSKCVGCPEQAVNCEKCECPPAK